MAKVKSKGIKVERCECSKCGEKATAQANTPHAFCRGFRLLKPLPPMFAKLRQPVKGIWTPTIPSISSVQEELLKDLLASGILTVSS